MLYGNDEALFRGVENFSFQFSVLEKRKTEKWSLRVRVEGAGAGGETKRKSRRAERNLIVGGT